MTVRTLQAALAALIGFGLGYLWNGCTHECECPEPGPSSIVETIYDTVDIPHQADPIRIEPTRARVKASGPLIVWQDTAADGSTDTVLIAQAFDMRLDTVSARGDSISVRASFPPPTLAMAIRPAPDTTQLVHRTVYIDRPVPQREPWYEEPAKAMLYIGGGFVAGYLTRLVTEDRCDPTIITTRPAEQATSLVTLKVTF